MHRFINWNLLRKAIYSAAPGKAEKLRDPSSVRERKADVYVSLIHDEMQEAENDVAAIGLLPGGK